MSDASAQERFWTVPNAVSSVRLLGIGPLLWAAQGGHRDLFLWIMIVLLLTDWLDGKLAVVLDQRTTIGARLDSVADALMYAGIVLSFWWLEEQVIRDHLGWLLGVGVSWVISATVAFFRFRRLPSYHTWSAKLAWLIVASTALTILLLETAFLLPWALGLVIFSNLHESAITFTLPEWEADVWSLRQAWKMRQVR